MFELKGWVELGGRNLSKDHVGDILSFHPEKVREFGGEFFIHWDDYCARDHFGIIPGDCPPGTIRKSGQAVGHITPDPMTLDLEAAIIEAVRLRSDEGVTALSGGVDSALVAALAGRPCVAVGIEGSHDLCRARLAAESIGLSCEYITITKEDVAEGISAVVPVIPSADPVNTAIAVTMHCITKWAGENGYRRVLAGQGADELFAGYSRYLTSTDLDTDLEKDFLGLPGQAERDQAVASLHGTYISMPYLDIRVVRAARLIPGHEKVVDGVRKRPLRLVAERHIPPGIAWYEKKAMQYGSGVWRTIRELARHN
ncbi:MAG: asparagine synthase C-terminal domain-containing protein, partial [Methanomicrobiales archaeon]